MPNYVSPLDLEDSRSLEIAEADVFPYMEKELTCIILVKVDPNFNGIFQIRIPETSPSYSEIKISNPKDAPWWAVIQNEHTLVSFDQPGIQPIVLFLGNDLIYKITLEARKARPQP